MLLSLHQDVIGPEPISDLSPHGIPGSPEDAAHLILPFFVIRFLVLLDAALPYLREKCVIGAERPDILDASHPPAGVVEYQQSPAPIVPAYFRAGQVHGAIGLLTPGLVPEEGAGVRQFFKDALVIKEFVLVRIDRNPRLLPGIIVINQEAVISIIFLDCMDISEVAAAFPALEAFESQSRSPPSQRRVCQIARPNSRAIRMMTTHSRKLECWMRTSSESIE